MSEVKLCLFASTPDMLQYKFVVKVLTGTPKELGQRAIDWGYDGIEFMPNPERVPDPVVLAGALRHVEAISHEFYRKRVFRVQLQLPFLRKVIQSQ